MLGNHLSRISCKVSLFSPAQRWAREPCAIETLSLTPLAVRQPSQLVFFFPLVFTQCVVKPATEEAQSEPPRQTAEGRKGWLEWFYCLCSISAARRDHKYTWEHVQCADLCSPCRRCWCELGERRKLPAKTAPFSFKFLPEHGLRVIEEPALVCPNKHKL